MFRCCCASSLCEVQQFSSLERHFCNKIDVDPTNEIISTPITRKRRPQKRRNLKESKNFQPEKCQKCKFLDFSHKIKKTENSYLFLEFEEVCVQNKYLFKISICSYCDNTRTGD